MYWIAPIPKREAMNFYGSGILQSGLPGVINVDNGYSTPYADTHPFTAAGLQVGTSTRARDASLVAGLCDLKLYRLTA